MGRRVFSTVSGTLAVVLGGLILSETMSAQRDSSQTISAPTQQENKQDDRDSQGALDRPPTIRIRGAFSRPI